MKFELREYHVEESNFKLNAFEGEKPVFKIAPNIKIDINKDGKNLKVTFSVTIESSEEKPTPFNIFVRLVSNFNVIEETLDLKLIQIESSRVVFPYLRTYVANLTLNAGIPPYHLPIINFESAQTQVTAPPKFTLKPQQPAGKRGIEDIKIIPPDSI